MAFFRILNWCCMALLVMLLAVSCKQKTTVLKSPPGYNFQDVKPQKLNDLVREASGLEWDPARNVFITHIDEKGKLFYLNRDTKEIVGEFDFFGKGDFEDVAMVNDTLYALISTGEVIKIKRESDTRMTGSPIGKVETGDGVDFEAMYYDSTRHALILVCKNCKVDNKATVSAYAYYLDSAKFNNSPVYQIDAAKIEQMAPKETSKFQPSAARIQWNLKKLFIISSAANLLVVADLNGVVESVHWLKPKMFPQPEGLAFNRSGDMYIVNEGVTSQATIYSFVASGKAKRVSSKNSASDTTTPAPADTLTR